LFCLYSNIPQEEEILTVCRACEKVYYDEPPIPAQLLERTLRGKFIPVFSGKHYLQTKQKWQFTLPIFSWLGLKQISNQSAFLKKKPLLEAIYRQDIFPLDFEQRGDNAVH